MQSKIDEQPQGKSYEKALKSLPENYQNYVHTDERLRSTRAKWHVYYWENSVLKCAPSWSSNMYASIDSVLSWARDRDEFKYFRLHVAIEPNVATPVSGRQRKHPLIGQEQNQPAKVRKMKS